MERFVVVAFRTMAATGDHYEERGGGIAFFPIDTPADAWQGTVGALVHAHFRNILGPVVQLGIASLDRDILTRHCREFQDCFWQGGDH